MQTPPPADASARRPRPAWAATTIRIAEPTMSDAEFEASANARVLAVDYAQGTLGLVWGKDVDTTGRSSWWMMPHIGSDQIGPWLSTTILPLVQSACDTLTVAASGDFRVAADAAGAMWDAVDEFTQRWCARPSPRGVVAECRHCGRRIYICDGGWISRVENIEAKQGQRGRDLSCPRAPERHGHEPKPAGEPGAPMVDFAPYHTLETHRAGDTTFTGSCSCGGWAATVPAGFGELGLDYLRHANGPKRA